LADQEKFAKKVTAHTTLGAGPAIAVILCALFFASGLAFLPHLGVEDDEALFAEAFYHPRGELYSLHVGHSHWPIMLMSYVGALKSWILRPVLLIFGPNIYAVRIPMLLVGAVSIWLFYWLLRKVAGERAALIGCALLSADSMYLLTVCFDWGPVALQHLLLIGGILLLTGFYQQGSERQLAAGFFLMGLAFWDKALAIWILSGMAVAAILTAKKFVLAVIAPRRLAISAAAFALGALPLLIYNAAQPLATFRGNVQRDFAGIPGKARMLASTAKGEGMFDWLIQEDWKTPRPHAPSGPLETASAKVSAVAGHPRQHLLYWSFLLALALTPLARGTDLRIILFSLITLAVAWIQMASTANTGGSVHHTILLWPLPQAVIAVAFAAASRRLGRAGIPAVAALTAVSTLLGFLVINEYYCVMRRNGGGQPWTDAIFRVSDYLKQHPAKQVVTMDWGMYDALRLLGGGKFPLVPGGDSVSAPGMSAEDRRAAVDLISDPGRVFVAHTREFEFFPGRNRRLIDFAAASGYRREALAQGWDSYGRQVYEIYRFVK
jgi:4-amino-4-deoxy-L-arabinose transferase-like glycosyltransferase